MNEGTAKKWLVISALGVFGIWWYRRFREGPQAVLEVPKFIAAWGTVYFVLSLVTEAAPGLGGSFSILVLVGDFLGNAMPKSGKGGLIADVTSQQKGKAPAGSALGGWDTFVTSTSTGVATGAAGVGTSATAGAKAAGSGVVAGATKVAG